MIMRCTIHDIYFDTLIEFEDHIKEHLKNPPKVKKEIVQEHIQENVINQPGEEVNGNKE